MFPSLNGLVPNGYKQFLGPMLTYDIQHKYGVLGLNELMQLIKCNLQSRLEAKVIVACIYICICIYI